MSVGIVMLAIVVVEVRGQSTGSLWQSRGIGGGGALYSASISPFDPDELYIATDMTVVFHSSDFARSWQGLPFTSLQGGTASTVRFTSDRQVLYAVDMSGDLMTPVRSSDGGQSWRPLAGDPTFAEAFFLDADPDATDTVLVSDYTTLYISHDGGRTFSPVYSAADGGAGVAVGGVLFDGTTIVVGTRDGLVVSSDAGQSFALMTVGGLAADEAIVSLAGAREAETVRLFAVTLDSGDVYGGVTGADYWGFRGAYRLDLGEHDSWQPVSTGIDPQANLFFVAMSRNEADVAWLAGNDGDSGAPVVYRTSDGGQTWSEVLLTDGNGNVASGWCGSSGDLEWFWAETALGFAVAPGDPQRAIITDYGFVHVTVDGGESWRAGYVAAADTNPAGSATPRGRAYRGIGLEDTSAWWLEWADDSTVVAAFTDIAGVRSVDGGTSWTSGFALGLRHNSTYHLLRHPDGTLYAATSSVHDIYQSTHLADDRIDDGEGSVLRSFDGGASWQLVHDLGHPVMWLALDAADSDTLYAAVAHSGEGGIYVTHDLGAGSAASWARLATPPRTQGHPLTVLSLNDGTLVASYSGRRDADGAFTESSGVFVSSDGGASWSDRSDAGMRRWTMDVVVDPHDAEQQTLYAAVFSHWGSPPNDVGGLYRSPDRGRSWRRIVDLHRVGSMTVSPVDRDVAYVTTETEGLWRIADLSSATPSADPVEQYPFRQPTRVFFNPFVAGEVWVTSFGNGLHVLAGSADCEPPAITAQPSDVAVAAGEVAQLTVAASGTALLEYQWYEGRSGDTSLPVAGATQASYTTPPLTGPASYWVRVTNACGTADSDTATVTVEHAAAWSALIPAVAHAPGAAGTQWRSDVAAANAGARPAQVTLTYRSTGGTELSAAATIAAGETLEWRNVLESLFNVAADVSTTGSVWVEAPSPLLIVSRTYNQATTGTYGQLLPAVTASDVLAPGATGLLPQLRRSAAFRTNIGAVNLADEPAQVAVTVYDGAGAVAGSFTLIVPARGWVQQFDALAVAGDLAAAFATAQASSGAIWAYASMVDNATGDPTTIPMVIGPLVVKRRIIRADAPALHVDDDAAAATADGSAERPYVSVQAAVDVAADGATVLVAAGSYEEDVRVSAKTVHLLGGFAGGTADEYASGQPGDFATRAGTSILRGTGDDAVVSLLEAGASTLDGFTVTGGGGSVENLPWSREGGGVFVRGGDPTISGCVIEGNDTRHPATPEADLRGGGIASEDASATIAGNLIRNNVSGRGGGLAILGGRAVVRDNRIVDNAGVDDHGGGVYAAGEHLDFTDNVISGNEIGRELGWGWGGGIIVFATGEPARIAGGRVSGNYAPNYGSGVFIDEGAEALLENLLVDHNLVDGGCAGGGAVAVDGGEGVGSRAELRFVTVADNPCDDSYVGGNGLRVEGLSRATVSSSIFWGNGGHDVWADEGSSVTVSYTTAEQALAGPETSTEDPLFADPAAGDYHLASAGGRWDAVSGAWVTDPEHSPAIDAGDPALDCSGEPQPNGARCNRGAYAGTAEASRSTGGDGLHAYLLAAVAHNPGAGQTVWRTDAGALSLSGSPTEATLTFVPVQGPARQASVAVPAGAQVEWRNVLESVLGVAPGDSVSGSLRVTTAVPLVVTARTYNQTPEGTYGQYLPAPGPGETLSPGERGWLIQMRSSGGYRSNVGVLVLAESQASVTVQLHDASGAQIGNPVVITAGPGEWRQVNDVFAVAGAGAHALASATVETDNGPVWVYASVLDGATGDPTTVPVMVQR